MIVLFHPRSTKPKNRRLPLSVLHLAAMLEGREEYEIVDGNADPDPSMPWRSVGLSRCWEFR
jgi:anaerobic magnesium-protoporphyrin IX monomethyl ester cyclase